jgi:hypothetical protein
VTTKEPSTVDRNANETALREVWYGRVLAEQGRRIPIKVDLSKSATPRPNRASRQDKVSA